jgi:hypothetical protein
MKVVKLAFLSFALIVEALRVVWTRPSRVFRARWGFNGEMA